MVKGIIKAIGFIAATYICLSSIEADRFGLAILALAAMAGIGVTVGRNDE